MVFTQSRVMPDTTHVRVGIAEASRQSPYRSGGLASISGSAGPQLIQGNIVDYLEPQTHRWRVQKGRLAEKDALTLIQHVHRKTRNQVRQTGYADKPTVTALRRPKTKKPLVTTYAKPSSLPYLDSFICATCYEPRASGVESRTKYACFCLQRPRLWKIFHVLERCACVVVPECEAAIIRYYRK